PMNRDSRRRASKLLAVAAAPPSRARKLSRKRWSWIRYAAIVSSAIVPSCSSVTKRWPTARSQVGRALSRRAAVKDVVIGGCSSSVEEPGCGSRNRVLPGQAAEARSPRRERRGIVQRRAQPLHPSASVYSVLLVGFDLLPRV